MRFYICFLLVLAVLLVLGCTEDDDDEDDVKASTKDSDTVVNDPDCECPSGPCCVNCGTYAATDEHVCQSNVKTKCEEDVCGTNVLKKTGTRICQGGTGACTGPIQWTEWEVAESCTASQICETTGTDQVSCGTCPDHCKDGICAWSNTATGLNWQVQKEIEAQDWITAQNYCGQLGDDWRLPTIDELRGIINGCAATETGGTCGVTEGSGYDDLDGCQGCDIMNGPGTEGCYLKPEQEYACTNYWSSSALFGYGHIAWYVSFYNGAVYYDNKGKFKNVCCVY